ncbi:Spc98 family-domain-containing protein [Bombardia bombarda]|uniref:Spindle pole body component n=1 Tax=Bombardia bombarda TaxID=252184 RepID=A0AA39WIB7_9PEZI|nr:Spc98 family-domain-containing protein [Bombardia bombarda]
MAYLLQLGALTDELVAAVAAIPDTQGQRLDRCRESTLRSLRHHSFLRTNQFDVDDHLSGYEEHFRVLGRDGLADAFRKSLDALKPHHNRFTPDVLHFILELADQPVQKTSLTDLYLLNQPEEEVVNPQLTWQDIAKEDGWAQDQALWRTIDYSPSSGEEDDGDDDVDDDTNSEASIASLSTVSSTANKHQRTAQDLIIHPPGGESLLKQTRESQAWRHASHTTNTDGQPKKIPISTPQLLRETLFMLAGLSTTLYTSPNCDPVTSYQLAGVSWQTHKALVTSFAECGRKLAPLRTYTKQQQQQQHHKQHAISPLLQVFQASLSRALRAFDRRLATIESRLVAIRHDAVVSLISVLSELYPHLAPLYALSTIVQRQMAEERGNPHAFRYLELLFDAVGAAQLQQDCGPTTTTTTTTTTYTLLGRIFFDCFQVYLKPIRLWMEEGLLIPGDRTFFVAESSTKAPPHQIWKSQFNLLRTPEGALHAPRFLRPAIDRIFTTGKSIVVLKHLRHHEARGEVEQQRMDFESVCCCAEGGEEGMEFAPFSELFGLAFDAWIQSKHHTASATLRGLLFNSYGLSRGLDALGVVYLGSDGAKADGFAGSVFGHLDGLREGWRDRFTLTEIAQEAFSSQRRVDGHRLSAEVVAAAAAAADQRYSSAVDVRASVRRGLPGIRLSYRLTWPVRIIVPEEGMQGYRKMFTCLLQVRRAAYVLRQPFLGFHAYGRGNVGDDDDDDYGSGSGDAVYFLLRTKLLWFCNTLMTYLTTLVLAPNTDRLHRDLEEAVDVDEMVAAHAGFMARVLGEACQGERLGPIREGILDVLDLAVAVEDLRRVEVGRREEEREGRERLVEVTSPFRGSLSSSPGKRGVLGRRVVEEDEDEDEDERDGGGDGMGVGDGVGELEAVLRKSVVGKKPYAVLLREMHGEFERHLRFVTGGLRGVARASRDEAAGKWDLLAEMLEVGVRE